MGTVLKAEKWRNRAILDDRVRSASTFCPAYFRGFNGML